MTCAQCEFMSPLEPVRDKMTSGLRGLLSGNMPGVKEGCFEGDPGLCGPGSTSWEVLADPAAMVAGIRSLLLQSCHPSAIQGVDEHSGFESDPLGRLHRTVAYVTVSTFGSVPEAQRMAELVIKAHQNVKGVRPDGVPYDANDPRLLLWVHVALVDSLLRSHQLYGKEVLTQSQQDAFVDEQSRIVALLGVTDAPRTSLELKECLDGFRSELYSTEPAIRSVRFIKNPPLPQAYKPFYKLLFAGAAATLEEEHRVLLGLPARQITGLQRTGTGAMCGALRALLREPESRVIAERRAALRA